MSAISLKSITGITSITTPAGADNQLTLHTNNTTEAVKLDTAGNLHFHNHLNITGVSSASNFKTGSTNVHSTGVELANINTGGGTATFGGNIHLGDGDIIKLGAGNDLTMRHNGSASVIENFTGNFILGAATSGNLEIRQVINDEVLAKFISNGAVELYHNNAKKLETKTSGVGVTGNLEVGSGQITCGTHGTTGIQLINDGTFGTIHSADLVLRTASAERLRITSGGKLNIANPSSGNVINLGSSTVYANAAINIYRLGNGYADMRLSSNYGAKIALAGASDNTDEFFIQQDNQKNAYIYNEAAKGIIFGTSNIARFRIDSSGRVLIGTTNEGEANADDLTIATTGHTGITLRSGTSNYGQIFFSDAESGTGEYEGIIAYDHSNNSMVFHTTRAERLRIVSDGRFGFGTNSPSSYALATFNSLNGIQLQGDGQSRILMRNNTGGTNEKMMDIQCNGNINIRTINDNYTTATTRATFRTDGNFVVGNRVGTSSPSTNQPVAFHSARVTPDTASSTLSNGVRCNLYVGSNTGWAAGDGGVIGMGGSRAGYAGQEAMWGYIKGSRQSGNGWEYAGKLELGTAEWGTYNTTKAMTIFADNQVRLHGDDSVMMTFDIGGATRLVIEHTGGGNMRLRNSSAATVTYSTSSDYRLKENATTINNALTTIKSLKPYQFTWKHDNKLGQGFFAHEAQEVLPDVGIVSGTKDEAQTEDDTKHDGQWKKDDPIYQSIDYSKLVPLLTAALQEETAKREALEARVAALEGS